MHSAHVAGVPVDIPSMKSHLSAPDFTSSRGEAEIVKIHLMIVKQRYS